MEKLPFRGDAADFILEGAVNAFYRSISDGGWHDAGEVDSVGWFMGGIPFDVIFEVRMRWWQATRAKANRTKAGMALPNPRRMSDADQWRGTQYIVAQGIATTPGFVVEEAGARWRVRAVPIDRPHCQVCGDPMTGQAPTGRPPRYCSMGCRRSAEFAKRRFLRRMNALEHRPARRVSPPSQDAQPI